MIPMAQQKRVLFVVDNLVMGGVTKVLANLISSLQGEGLSIDVMALHRHDDMMWEIPQGVRILEGGKRMAAVDASMGKLLHKKDLLGILRKLLFAFKIKTGWIQRVIRKDRKENIKENYDAEIAFGDGFPYLYTSLSQASQKIAWMHSDVSVMDYSKRYRKRLQKVLKGYHNCVAVSDGVAKAYRQIYGVENLRVIHNLMKVEEIKAKAAAHSVDYDPKVLNFVTVGRLDYSKNYPMLLDAVKALTQKGYDFRLYLVGEGADREILEQKIAEGSLGERAFLLGSKDNPYPFVKQADCFLLSSRYEGLPTVVLEALILGTPCVCTKVAGIDRIMKPEYGLVVENDPEAFIRGVEQVLAQPEQLKAFRENLRDYTYDNESLKQQILGVIHGDEVCEKI